MNLRDQIVTSVVRTTVPALVALILSVSVFSDVDSEALTVALSGVVMGAVYAVIRWAESVLSPAFGWLLGWAKAPNYEPPAE